jgi:hypothetical protein
MRSRGEQRRGQTGTNCSANELGRYERGNMVDRDASKGCGEAAGKSAGEECSQLYRICNWSCDRPIDAVDNFLVCKSQCDRRLIACDRRPINASTLGGRSLPGLTLQGNDRSIAD